MSRRRKQEALVTPNAQPDAVAPWVDQWGREVWNNPWGQYRPNPRLTVTTAPRLRNATGLPVVPPVAAPTTPPPPLPTPIERHVATPSLRLAPPPLQLDAPTHQATEDGLITADDERIRATIQYAKGYAKACRALGIEIPTEVRDRLESHTSQRRGRVHKRVRRTAAASIALGAGFVGINAAAAYFTTGGSGHGAATTGSVTVSVNAATGTPSTPLYPGGTGDVTLKVDNPNNFPVTLTKVEGNGTITASGGKGTCNTPTGVTFTDQTSLNQSLPANSTNNAVDLTGAASMGLSTADGCQGATFTIPVKVTVQQP